MASRSAKTEAELSRHVSLSELASLLDRDRNTVSKWLTKDGCPAVQRANRDIGQSWVLDVAAVVAWLEDRAAKSAAGSIDGDDVGTVSYEEAKRREKVASAVMAELELDERRREVARVIDTLDAVAREYASLRSALQSVGGMVAPRLIGLSIPSEIQNVVDEAIADALEALTHDTTGGRS